MKNGCHHRRRHRRFDLCKIFKRPRAQCGDENGARSGGNDMKNLNLILSICILIPVAFGYGLVPKTTLPWAFDIRLETVDMMNICRTIMILYLSTLHLFEY